MDYYDIIFVSAFALFAGALIFRWLKYGRFSGAMLGGRIEREYGRVDLQASAVGVSETLRVVALRLPPGVQMKKSTILSMTTSSLLAFLISGAAPAQDAAVVNPKTVKVNLDNASVRVLETSLSPGQKEQVHSHPACVIYVITGGKVRSHLPDGKTVDGELAAGATIYRDPVTHWTENIGTTTVHLVIVELKDQEPIASVEEGVRLVQTFKGEPQDFRLVIPESLMDPVGMNIAIITNEILKRGWMPDDVVKKPGYRVFTYKVFSSEDFKKK